MISADKATLQNGKEKGKEKEEERGKEKEKGKGKEKEVVVEKGKKGGKTVETKKQKMSVVFNFLFCLVN